MSEQTQQPETPRDEAEQRGDAPEQRAAESEDRTQTAVPLDAIPTRELLVLMLGVLGAKAWQGMGLVANPASGKIEKNLEDAKTAIDAFAGLLDAVRPHLEAQARRDTESLLTTLRLNFVEKSGGS
ncbi:MAG TPA: DUF1844 domain-containing protein [bacterium]|nr:DUF1844 domain-containing protein [bacterium]